MKAMATRLKKVLAHLILELAFPGIQIPELA
jgi:hypothetical protein